MTYHNLCGWHTIPADCTRIEGGNLSGVVFPTDREIVVVGCLIDKDNIPSNVNVADCGYSANIVDAPERNLHVGSKAELVFRSLISSGKLPETMIPAVEQMLIMVKSKVNVTDIELGLAATIQTQEIIDSFKQIGDTETVQQLEQALLAVQTMWRIE